jgi:hypothetical protein
MILGEGAECLLFRKRKKENALALSRIGYATVLEHIDFSKINLKMKMY